MPVPYDTYLPSYEELTVPELTVSYPVLKAASLHMGKYCDNMAKEYMLCKSEYRGDPRPCVNEGKELTKCSIDFLNQVKSNCNEVFSAYWNCLDRKGHLKFSNCRDFQKAVDECFATKLGVSRPEVGFFSKVRIHDSPRPKPEREEVVPEPRHPRGSTDRTPRNKHYGQSANDF